MKINITIDTDKIDRVEVAGAVEKLTDALPGMKEKLAETETHLGQLNAFCKAQEKVIEELKVQRKGWLVPKVGDRLRCIALPTGMDFDTTIKFLKVGNEYTVTSIGGASRPDTKPYDAEGAAADPEYWFKRSAYGVMFRFKGKGDEPSNDVWFPIELFEAVK